MGRKNDILERRSKDRPFNHDFVTIRPLGAVRPVKGYLTSKLNITFSVTDYILNIFYSTIFFLKKAYFPWKL